MIAGWLAYEYESDRWALGHTSGTYIIGGFRSRYEAMHWLQDYILRCHAQQAEERLARDRILAEMPVEGRVS